MDDPELAGLRQMMGQYNKVVYEAVKSGRVADLSGENQIVARAMSEHMHLKHVHNALEFADVREGEPYEIEVDGNVVSPLAHITTHAAIKGQIEADPPVTAAFEKLVATGTTAHHAEHILVALFAEYYFQLTQAEEFGGNVEKARTAYYRKIKKITQDAAYRKKLQRQVPGDHFGFD